MAAGAAAAGGAIAAMLHRNTRNFHHPGSSIKDQFIRAVQQNNLSAVKHLLQRGVSLSDFRSSPYNYQELPLHIAVTKGYCDMASWLIGAGADVNQRNWMSEVPIQFASRNGDQNMVKLLLKAGAKVDKRTENGNTALMYAAQFGHVDLVRFLIANGADRNAVDNKGNGLLHWATLRTKNSAMLSYLISQGFCPDQANIFGETPVHKACKNAGLPELTLLAEQGATLTLPTASGATSLHYASNSHQGEQIAKVKLLLGNQVDVNQADSNGVTPLHIAARQGNSRLVETFLEAGSDPNKTDQAGRTALHKTLSPHIADSLLAAGAKVNAADTKGNTPLLSAVRNMYQIWPTNRHLCVQGEGMANLLMKAGAQVNVKGEGYAPLYYAILYGSSPLIQNMLDRGASVKALNPKGHDAYQVANDAEKRYGMREGAVRRLLNSYSKMSKLQTLRRTYIIGHRQSRDTVMQLQAIYSSDQSIAEKDTLGLQVLARYQKLKQAHHYDYRGVDVKFWALRRFALSQGKADFGQWTVALLNTFRNQNRSY